MTPSIFGIRCTQALALLTVLVSGPAFGEESRLEFTPAPSSSQAVAPTRTYELDHFRGQTFVGGPAYGTKLFFTHSEYRPVTLTEEGLQKLPQEELEKLNSISWFVNFDRLNKNPEVKAGVLAEIEAARKEGRDWVPHGKWLNFAAFSHWPNFETMRQQIGAELTRRKELATAVARAKTLSPALIGELTSGSDAEAAKLRAANDAAGDGKGAIERGFENLTRERNAEIDASLSQSLNR